MMGSRDNMVGFLSVSRMLTLIYCMMLSSVLTGIPVLGGSLITLGTVAQVAQRLFSDKEIRQTVKTGGLIAYFVLIIINVFLVVLNPVSSGMSSVWALVAITATILIRDALCERFIKMKYENRAGEKKTFVYTIITQVVCIGLALLAMLLVPETSVYIRLLMVIGYGVTGIIEYYSYIRWGGRTEDYTPQDMDAQKTLSGMYAYRAYSIMSFIVLMALQFAILLMCTFMGFAGDESIVYLLLASICILAGRETANFALDKAIRREPDAVSVLLVGLLLWLGSMAVFAMHMQKGHTGSPWILFSFALCVCSATVCVTALSQIRDNVYYATIFAGRKTSRAQFNRVRSLFDTFAILLGQSLAMVAMNAMMIFSAKALENATLQEFIASSINPVLTIPAGVLIVFSMLTALRFPLYNRYIAKLRIWLRLNEQGENDPLLDAQLESAVVNKNKRHWGIQLIIWLLRPFYRHKLIGAENLKAAKEEGGAILVCNHGELYGPVTTCLNLPIQFRFWSIASLMDDLSGVTEYIYANDSDKWWYFPKFLRKPFAKLLAHLSIWAFSSLENIPVYRANPRELMKTFRMTIQAMQARDNILIFPENAPVEEGGYLREGIGNFYTGFVQLAQSYYSKTGKRSLFIPIYASKKEREIAIGTPIRFNADRPINEEKDRVIAYLQGAIRQMQSEVEKPKASAPKES
ncbi:MAG: lysophospholipid acyltransferase family protein [Eubacteriales bacterium]|nr:lysophospholipid acyltransferase family protein [Eubacteriales bacterium]MDD3883088.1 lysophospholipid acyltransferase family protein [Eubacteriales bacterium]MDD4512613.1 lysophospholipid acyltransferase family protein [Eubacteriales bacterium]